MANHAASNWDDSRYLLLAAQAGTLAGAVRSAGVQHATIGRRLTVLERSLDAALSGVGLAVSPCPLADHEPRRVRSTPRLMAERGLSIQSRSEAVCRSPDHR